MRPALTLLVVALAILSGCDLSSSDGRNRTSPRVADRPRPPEPGSDSYEGRVIRGWLLALDRADYEGAAYYFAPGAVIDQGRPYRLRNRSAARTFNASLPCRADLVEVVDEGKTVLASFRLRRGPGGECSGVVKVRFTIRRGKFTEWRQLPQEPAPSEEGTPAAEPA